ncbi:hypothetical protein C0991_008514, partial [Blastosporella zonata]
QKKRAAVEFEDPFSDEVAEDLIPSQSVSTKAKASKLAGAGVTKAAPLPKASTSKAPVKAKSSKLSDKARAAQFAKIVAFITPRIGRHPTLKMPMVRNSAWVHLVQLSTGEQQLDQVSGMFPGWVAAGNKFDHAFSELFVRAYPPPSTLVLTLLTCVTGRCEELKCPLVALKVYGDFPKYSLPLSLPAARQLLHSLHTKYPLENVMTAASLYDVYKLPAVSEDLVSASLVAAACFKHNSKASRSVGMVIAPQIKKLLKTVQLPTEETKKKETPVTFAEKPSIWAKWALKKVDKGVAAYRLKQQKWYLWRQSQVTANV